ncbi:MAG: DUF1549 domain-containing protein [Planctomycetaceae bacterium]|nr:DUF1549 domain-containing protein [Planctomycetaceae bacterium]
MDRRDVLFIGICFCGLIAVASNLLNHRLLQGSVSLQEQDPGTRTDIQETIQRVNDTFRQHWENANLQVASPAPDLQIARRLSLALAGTTPSFEEIRILQELPAEDRIPWWINHLLSDRRYADYLAERLARAYVGTEQGPFLVYRRRRFVTWLSDQLAENRPYDELVRELVTVNGLWTDSPAANFLTVTIDQNDDNQPDEARLAGRITRAFLGIRIDCLQCHDDKLDQIVLGPPGQPRTGLQSDFHHLAAYFGSVENSLLGIRDQPNQEYLFKYLGQEDQEQVTPTVPFFPQLAKIEGSKREQLASWLTADENKAFSRATVNRIWAIMLGQPLVNPIDSIPLHGPFPPGLQILADDFTAHGFDLARLIRIIASLQVFQMDSRADFTVTTEHENQWAVFPLTRLRPEQVAGGIIQACSLTTIDANAHILRQLGRYFSQNEFIKRYGDLGEDEFGNQGGTITQRLLMLNGKLIDERTKDNPFTNASTRIMMVTRDPARAVETGYLCVLSRLPTGKELEYFRDRLQALTGKDRARSMEDLFWVLLNSTEFSWNH